VQIILCLAFGELNILPHAVNKGRLEVIRKLD
jgi:hypothetical protein